MKISKNGMIILSFTVGACVFISTAFADMALGSGYDRLKSSAKSTAAQMEKGLNNYTVETLYAIKDNGQTVLQTSSVERIDNEKQASENTTTSQNAKGEASGSYSYSDRNVSIWKGQNDGKYIVQEFPKGYGIGGTSRFDNPFDDNGEPEIERLVDALVGNLKDYVQAEELPDGGRVYSGSLTETQVPAVVNAVASFGIKRMMSDRLPMQERDALPEMASDLYLDKISGRAVENKAGLLESVTGDVLFKGKDKNGTEHDLALNVVLKLADIGITKVARPDLTEANSQKVNKARGFDGRYVGQYKNDIVIEKNGGFVKIGERILEITSVDEHGVTGKYTEIVKPGFEAVYPDPDSFTFTDESDDSQPDSFFTYTNAKGEQEQAVLHPAGNGKIYLGLNIKVAGKNSYSSSPKSNFDGEFIRVFDQ